MIEHREILIEDEDDIDDAQHAFELLQEAALLLIEQSEKRGGRPKTEAGEMIIPVDLGCGIRIAIIKEYEGKQH